jgi:dTDP-4-dehydrorhamnose reductase
MKILLTGASGLVGSAFARSAAQRGHSVIGITGSFTGRIAELSEQSALDLEKLEHVTQHVLNVFPDLIVNCAAISEPAACDADPERSEALNVKLPHRLAELAQHLGARLVHLSSEQVFDGRQRGPYHEEDPVSPLSLYGRQKVASELATQQAAPKSAVIIRAPLLMGDSPTGTRAVHERLLAAWSRAETARLFTDELRQPCTAENLADVMVEITERPDLQGIYHWAGLDLVSRYELGILVREHFKLRDEDSPIKGVARADALDATQKRPASLPLDCTKLTSRLKTRAQTIRQQLESLRVPTPCRKWYLGRT